MKAGLLVLPLPALVACEQVDALGACSAVKPEYLEPPEHRYSTNDYDIAVVLFDFNNQQIALDTMRLSVPLP